jgi:hypothetical protein
LPVCAIFQLGFLTSLEVLELSDSGLHGTLPTELAQLEQMSALHTSRASISGTLPTQLGLLSMLEYLKLDENQISGSLVPELGDLVRARHIDLEANPISGTVPDMFVRFRGLEYWNTFGCNLTGHLPQTVKRIAQRREHFEFFVQDEQLELMADFKCRRDNFRYQRDHPVREGGRPFKGNFGLRQVRPLVLHGSLAPAGPDVCSLRPRRARLRRLPPPGPLRAMARRGCRPSAPCTGRGSADPTHHGSGLGCARATLAACQPAT